MIALLLLFLVGFLVVRWVRRRRAVLAGLEATKPTYSVPPPGGRVGRRDWEAL